MLLFSIYDAATYDATAYDVAIYDVTVHGSNSGHSPSPQVGLKWTQFRAIGLEMGVERKLDALCVGFPGPSHHTITINYIADSSAIIDLLLELQMRLIVLQELPLPSRNGRGCLLFPCCSPQCCSKAL